MLSKSKQTGIGIGIGIGFWIGISVRDRDWDGKGKTRTETHWDCFELEWTAWLISTDNRFICFCCRRFFNCSSLRFPPVLVLMALRGIGDRWGVEFRPDRGGDKGGKFAARMGNTSGERQPSSSTLCKSESNFRYKSSSGFPCFCPERDFSFQAPLLYIASHDIVSLIARPQVGLIEFYCRTIDSQTVFNIMAAP